MPTASSCCRTAGCSSGANQSEAPVRPVLIRSGLQYSLRHPWQLGLAVLGIALGVAVVVSIDLANASAARAFVLSAESVLGTATHQVRSGPHSLSDAVYRRLRIEAGVRRAAPVVQGYVSLVDHPGHTFLLRGIDLFAEQGFRSYTRSLDEAVAVEITKVSGLVSRGMRTAPPALSRLRV